MGGEEDKIHEHRQSRIRMQMLEGFKEVLYFCDRNALNFRLEYLESCGEMELIVWGCC